MGGGGIDMHEVKAQMNQWISLKADNDKLDKLALAKANKTDTEICLRWVDLLHRMVK